MPNFNSLLDLKHRRLVILDVRATGFDPNTDRIIEVGAVVYSPGRDPRMYHKIVNPCFPILAAATQEHGLAYRDVAGAEPFELIAPGLARFLGAADLVGFGMRRFTYPLLDAEFKRVAVSFDRTLRSVVDLEDLYHQVEPRDLNSAMNRYLGRRLAKDVDALRTASHLAELFEAQLKNHEELPRTIKELAIIPGRRHPDGWYNIEFGSSVFTEGPFRGRSPAEVAGINPDYLRSMLGPSLDWTIRRSIEMALERLIPLPQPKDDFFTPLKASESAESAQD